MSLSKQIANHLRHVFFGGNWTTVNYKDTLADVDWQTANRKVGGVNSIASLVYHVAYYIPIQLKVLQGGPLEGKDANSWQTPDIQSQEDWEKLLQTVWANVEATAAAIEQLPDEKLEQGFIDEKYGTYFRNLQGNIEHLHYHLGQIVVIKKVLSSTTISTN